MRKIKPLRKQSEEANYTTGKECDKYRTTRKESGRKYSSMHIMRMRR